MCQKRLIITAEAIQRRGAAPQLAPLAFDLGDQSFFVLCWRIAGGKNKRMSGVIT